MKLLIKAIRLNDGATAVAPGMPVPPKFIIDLVVPDAPALPVAYQLPLDDVGGIDVGATYELTLVPAAEA